MTTVLKILMVGDVAAKTGRFALRRTLPSFIATHDVDFVVVNGENIAGGIGITPDLADELFSMDVDVITSGNHIWRKWEIRNYINDTPRLLRPFNYVPGQPGQGIGTYRTAGGTSVGVINLAGQVYMDVHPDNPFVCVEAALKALSDVSVIVVDFHAEATSEKRAMGFHLDGRVSAVVGTHTHVQTADAQILPRGTAYLTDLGMTGPHDSIIGMRKDEVMTRFVTGMPSAFKPSKGGPRFQGALISVDACSGNALSIERVDLPVEE